MRQDNCYRLGKVIKTHGLKGEVSILLEVDYPDEYQNLESVFLQQNGKLVPFFIESIQTNSNKAITKFEEVDSVEAAAGLVKSEIYLPISLLPKLPEGKYYFHDLGGCEVFENNRKIGSVKEVIGLNGNEFLNVDHDGKEVLIPIKDEILTKVLVKEKRLEVALPEGLLEL
ncbi:MAG: 16S rRNA processing protein RimM [Ekhidna sp.]|nr:16S rRNA processing protein RimM [Ekhidna sp.]MBC6410952.1 16S rRNA processing protein RimM [Ekhidna sp.]MBC6426454.1 16S rRNA processing protein RimM [Ekhidna sp.]